MIQKTCTTCQKSFEIEFQGTGPEACLDDLCFECYQELDQKLAREDAARKQERLIASELSLVTEE